MSGLEDRRAAKQAVLSKVNQVLVSAGLNDTVWSIRDCDSTLFVLVYKKLVGKVRTSLRARDASPLSSADAGGMMCAHAAGKNNFLSGLRRRPCPQFCHHPRSRSV